MARARRPTSAGCSATRVDDSFSWFVPNKAGDHELKFGMLYSYIPLHFRSFSNENGTFTFRA